MMNRFSSVGYIGAEFFLSEFLRSRFLFFFIFFSPFSSLDPDPCIPPVTVQKRRCGPLPLCPSGGTPIVFFIIFLFFFFFSSFSPLPPPLGKSSASSKISLVGGRGSLETGTGLLGFHGFALPVLSCCLCLLNLFDLGVLFLKSSSLKKIWLGLWLLGVW